MKDVSIKNGKYDKSKERKKIRLFYTAIIFLTIIVLTAVYFLVSIDPGTDRTLSPKTRQMRRLAAKIGRLEKEVHEKQNKLFNLLKAYTRKTGEPPPENGAKFSNDEKKILEDKFNKEKDVSIKALLKEILYKDSEITALKTEMGNFETLIPKPHIAGEGESHYQIAVEFLIYEKKVEKEKALRLVEKAVLFDLLIPGFRVWNFYSGDEFGTFVTQGSAGISPTEFRKTPEKYLDDILDRIDGAIAEKEKLADELKRLKSEKSQLSSMIDDLRNEKQEMSQKLHSLFFMVDLEENLLKKGIIRKSGFLKLGSLKLKEILPKEFDQKIDLRGKKVIEIRAGQFKLSKIKKVTLYPGFYKRGTDYKIEINENNQKAIVTILAVDKFRSERVVITVE